MSAVLEQIHGTPDRRLYVGGSDIAGIMGIDGYGKTPLDVFYRKVGEQQEPMDMSMKKFLRRRKRWEGPIIEMLREEYGQQVLSTNRRYRDANVPYFAAEIDFEAADPDGVILNGEIKTVHPLAFHEKHGWGEAGTDQIPVHYAAQVMWGLGVTNRERCVVAAMPGLDDMIFYDFWRDEDTIAEMREAATKFWTDHVLTGKPPAPINMGDIKRYFTKVNGRPVEASADLLANLRRMDELRETQSNLKEEKEQLDFLICDEIRRAWGLSDIEENAVDDAIILDQGKSVATWKRQRGASLDQRGIRDEHPELHKKFMRNHYFRVLRIKK